MKKYLLLATSALLFLAGCAKDDLIGNRADGGLTTVTFTASMDNGTATKAVADGDGAAASVNRCIMEIYYGDALFARQIKAVTDKNTSFTCQVVANRTYTVAFWADHVTAANTTPTEAELAVDLYYKTNGTNGLQEIALAKDTLEAVIYAGNNDARDAFYAVKDDCTVAQAGTSFDIKLRRPFAQMNVITTDWDKVSTVSGLKPDKVDVTIQSPLTKFNAVTGVASADDSVTSLNYNADLYTAPAPVEPVSTTEKTLSMDYLFASADKAVIDIAWKAQHGTDADVSHSFTNIPYQRNYRTNIKGALLTTTGQWNVTVDPVWTGEYTKVIEVADIQSANSAIAANTSANTLDVVFKSEPDDAGTPGTDNGARAIVTTPVAESATLSIEVQSSTKTLYVGDYESETNISSISSSAKTAVVNINVPTGSSIGTLVINAPNKSVYINGKQVSNVGTITNLEAITSQNTLIIEAGQTVDTLTMRQGGLEIHGTVNAVVIPEVHGTIVVRDCENLSQEVYDVLDEYIAEDYVSKKGRTTAEKWDIYPATCKIGNVLYGSLQEAVDAASATPTTITMIANETFAENTGVTIAKSQDITLDLNGKVIGNNITVATASATVTNYGSLTIKDSSADADGIITNGATEEATGDWWSDPQKNWVTNTISNLGTLVLESGNIQNTAAGISYCVDNNSNGVPATFEMKGGKMTDVGCVMRLFCNTTQYLNKVVISGGVIESKNSVAFWVQLPGSGGEAKQAYVEISGGTLIGSTSQAYCWYDYSYGDVFDNVAYNITGGKFVGGIYSYKKNYKFITGGLFDKKTYVDGSKEWELSSMVADGCQIVANTDASTSAEYPWKVIDTVPTYTDGSYSGRAINVGDIWWAPVNCGYEAASGENKGYIYGKLYQWGRKDGQGYYRTIKNVTYEDATYPTAENGNLVESQTASPEAAKFYCAYHEPFNWYNGTNPAPDDLWGASKTAYDPCPEGWRVPTISELETLINVDNEWVTDKDVTGLSSGSYNGILFGEKLFFPAAGERGYSGGASNRNSRGKYWSSTLEEDGDGYYFYILDDTPEHQTYRRACGLSVRCVSTMNDAQ